MWKLPSWWFVEIIFYKPVSCFSLWRPRPQRGLSSLEALIRFCFQSTYGKRRNIKDGELGVSDNCLLPICKGGTKKEKALLVRACACDCPLEAKNLYWNNFLWMLTIRQRKITNVFALGLPKRSSKEGLSKKIFPRPSGCDTLAWCVIFYELLGRV